MDSRKREMVERFMKHGIDISPYKFHCHEDKFQFFTMYIHYLESIDDGATGYISEFDEDINLEVYDGAKSPVGKFIISEDYTTLRFALAPGEDVTEEYAQHVNFLITVFFLALKEFNSNIAMLQEILSPVLESASTSGSKKYKNVSEFEKKINKIRALQKEILSENKKYESVPKKQGEEQ